MSTLTEIRAAIKTTLKAAIPELSVYDTVPEVNNVPAVIIEPHDADYASSMSLDTEWQIDLFVLVSSADVRRAQKELDSYITGYGSNSIRQAIHDTPDLGLPDTTAFIRRMHGYNGTYETAKLKYVGAILRMHVVTGTA